METTGWWSCPECAGVVELDGVLAEIAVPCPDCGAGMQELAQWEAVA